MTFFGNLDQQLVAAVNSFLGNLSLIFLVLQILQQWTAGGTATPYTDKNDDINRA